MLKPVRARVLPRACFPPLVSVLTSLLAVRPTRITTVPAPVVPACLCSHPYTGFIAETAPLATAASLSPSTVAFISSVQGTDRPLFECTAFGRLRRGYAPDCPSMREEGGLPEQAFPCFLRAGSREAAELAMHQSRRLSGRLAARSGRQRRAWAQRPTGVYHQRCDDQCSAVERRTGGHLLQEIPGPQRSQHALQ